jgi:small subunit ribosomal protein S11
MGKKKIVKKTDEQPKTTTSGEVVAKSAPATSARQKIENGRVYIQASYNNTLITVTDSKGNVVTWMSAGSMGFSGPKKATPFAASKVAEAVAEKVSRSGPSNIEIYIRGVGKGRDAAVRSLAAKGFNILAIKDVTPVPHNGPRARKVRRV